MSEPKLFRGEKFVDDRGHLTFCNNWSMDGIKRFYQVENHLIGSIRAFHGHQREEKFVYVPQGSAQIVLVPMPLPEITSSGQTLRKFTLSSQIPAVLYIPAGWYNGFKVLSQNTILMFFSTATLEESKNDDVRLAWNALGAEVWQEDFR